MTLGHSFFDNFRTVSLSYPESREILSVNTNDLVEGVSQDDNWAVPGFKDTLLRCFMELEVLNAATQEVFQGVQA
jgi:hypothetical protein